MLSLALVCLFFASFGQGTSILEEYGEVQPNKSSPLPFHKAFEIDGQLYAVDYGGGKVYHSKNLGNSWKNVAQLESEYFEAIQFVTNKIGYVCGDYGNVYKTIDGGKTWKDISPRIAGRIKERYRNDETKNQKPDGLFIAYYHMFFGNEKEGFVAGFQFNPSKGFRESYQRLLFQTHDGGKKWVKIPIDQHQNVISKYVFFAAQNGIPLHDEYYKNSADSWRVKTSAQESMLIHSIYNVESDTLILPPSGFSRVMLRKIVFLNDDLGFVFGGALDKGNEKAVIYFTKNGGIHWELMKTSWPHLHDAILNDKYLFLFGKEGLVVKVNKSKVIRHFNIE